MPEYFIEEENLKRHGERGWMQCHPIFRPLERLPKKTTKQQALAYLRDNHGEITDIHSAKFLDNGYINIRVRTLFCEYNDYVLVVAYHVIFGKTKMGITMTHMKNRPFFRWGRNESKKDE